MKKIIVFICLFLFVFLGCRKDKNSTEFFENSLIYKIAEELYFDNSLADIFKNRIGLGLKCQIFETKSKSYTAVFPQINTYGDGWLEMYGKDVDGTIVFSGDSTISAKKLPEGRKVIEFEFTVPENWKSIASIFDETYDKKISIIKKVLIQFTENERKSDGNTFLLLRLLYILMVFGSLG